MPLRADSYHAFVATRPDQNIAKATPQLLLDYMIRTQLTPQTGGSDG